MAQGFETGTRVEWDWGRGSGTGRIVEVYTQKQTLVIKGSEITRNASEDCPAYRIEQENGNAVLKSHSEVREA